MFQRSVPGDDRDPLVIESADDLIVITGDGGRVEVYDVAAGPQAAPLMRLSVVHVDALIARMVEASLGDADDQLAAAVDAAVEIVTTDVNVLPDDLAAAAAWAARRPRVVPRQPDPAAYQLLHILPTAPRRFVHWPPWSWTLRKVGRTPERPVVLSTPVTAWTVRPGRNGAPGPRWTVRTIGPLPVPPGWRRSWGSL